MACSKQRVPPTSNSPRGSFVCNYFDLFCLKHGTGHPGDQPCSREWGAESTPLENNPPSMEDTVSPSWYMSYSSIQNRIFIWRFRVWHIQIYLERQVDTAYRKVWWTHMEWLWGLRDWMHKQYSRLVQVKASKRLGSDQLESDNSHVHALKLINIGCKHE
jgi:hypothetical protein